MTLYPAIQTFLDSLGPELAAIPPERRALLESLGRYVRSRTDAGLPARMTFICTHNSRRSHFGQVWAAVCAARHGLAPVESYSGGTEATAFNPRAVAALERAGFDVANPGGSNPHYALRYADAAEPLICYSKVYHDPANPARDFCAVMTCSEADEACPFIPGAALRLPLAYEDPKVADGTPAEQARYDERCRQIAAELEYMAHYAATLSPDA